MRFLRVVAWRLSLGLVAAWTIMTTVFALFRLTREWVLDRQLGGLKWAGAEEDVLEATREQYFAARGLNRPLWEQYVDWMTSMLALDWGHSFLTGDPAFPMVIEATARTATYVAPALVLAVLVGISIGLYAALNPDSRLANAGLGSTYLLFAVPNFWVGGLLLSLARGGVIGDSPFLFEHVLPIALTATTLTGGIVSYARSHSAEYASADFVRLVTAKGASRVRVARHVLRNAAIPIFSMVFTEALALLVLSVFVIEVLFGIEGLGRLLFESIEQRDLPVLLGGTLVIIAVGVVGTIVQDLSYGVLDPRVDTSDRS